MFSAIVLFASMGAFAQEDNETPPLANLDLIQRLSTQVCDSVASFVRPGDSVRIVLHPIESTWYIEGVIIQRLNAIGATVTQSVVAPFEIELGLLSTRISYEQIRRRGLFGAKVLDRNVGVEFTAKVVDKNSGTILMHGTIARDTSDVVEAGDVEGLENPAIPATHGTLPREGFFSTIFEPLIAMGAIAVAVYLLFHVRS